MSGSLDPIFRRGPRAHWTRPDPRILDEFVIRLAEFFSHNDIKRVDNALLERANAGEVASQQLASSCVLHLDGPGKTRILIECSEHGSREFALRAWVELIDGQPTRGKLISVRLDDAEQTIGVDLKAIPIDYQPRDGRLSISFVQSENLNPRRRNGDLIEHLELVWLDTETDPEGTIQADATLTLRSDFSVLSTAIEQMIQNNLVGEVDTLSDHPFRRRSLLEALYRELGLPKLTWCC